MRYFLSILLLCVVGCGKARPAEPSNANSLTARDMLTRAQDPVPPDPEPVAPVDRAPAGTLGLVATVDAFDESGLPLVTFESDDPGGLTDVRLGLYRHAELIAVFMVVFAGYDDERDVGVLTCKAVMHGDYDMQQGDQFYLLSGNWIRRVRSSGSSGGLNMPFGESMFGPWHAGGGSGYGR
jgi:hypothetical protein